MLQNMRGVHPKGVINKRTVTGGGIGGVGNVRPVLTEQELQLRKLNGVSGSVETGNNYTYHIVLWLGVVWPVLFESIEDAFVAALDIPQGMIFRDATRNTVQCV